MPDVAAIGGKVIALAPSLTRSAAFAAAAIAQEHITLSVHK
jgi:hypothetical protein